MNKPLLTKTECSAMRGVAILGIVLHNYCHWLGLAVKENEYQFHRNNCEELLNAVLHADWNLPIHLLSFFGHYGVPVFLFLSGFGLVLKYEERGERREE
ncbi:MAG: acyltransferase, partial [Prevotella sp.]|nr:acyltransferase [Prevotella sp.]